MSAISLALGAAFAELLNPLVEAIKENTAAHLGAGAASTTATKTTATKTTTTKVKDSKPAYTLEQAMAALSKIKDDFPDCGLPEAKAILTAHGISKMAEIPADKTDVIFNAAAAKYDELKAAAEAGSADDL